MCGKWILLLKGDSRPFSLGVSSVFISSSRYYEFNNGAKFVQLEMVKLLHEVSIRRQRNTRLSLSLSKFLAPEAEYCFRPVILRRNPHEIHDNRYGSVQSINLNTCQGCTNH